MASSLREIFLKKNRAQALSDLGVGHKQLHAAVAHLTEALKGQSAALDRIEDRQDTMMEALQLIYEREPEIRERLALARRTESYELAFTDPEPLVSVVIATYQNHAMLRERSLPSVLAQTYRNLEVIVVGDAAPDEARAAVEEVGDERFRFFNRPIRGPYPEDEKRRWLVAGAPPWNEATQMASGRWIASLDDDDAWRPDHIERLLELARRERAELAYGAIVCHERRRPTRRLGVFPPEAGTWALQAAVYHGDLVPLFAPELGDGTFYQPAESGPQEGRGGCDWGMLRRMLRAGVRMAFDDVATVDYYPAHESYLK